MNMYLKTAITYAAAVIVAVVLYAPGLLALRISDPGVIRPALALICAAVLVALVAWRTWATITAAKREQALAGRHGAAEKAAAMLAGRASNPITGQLARSGMAELDAARRKSANLDEALAAKFARESLTYTKFMDAVDMASLTIEKNTLLLASRIQAFDDTEYRQLAMVINTGSYRRDNIPDPVQEEKARLYNQQINEMNAIVAANESLLLELDKFSAEIGKITAGSNTSESEAMIAELRQLASEAQYYKSLL